MSGQVEAWKTWGDAPRGADLSEWQDGRCAWCGTDMWALVTDHCHETGLVRGLLCAGCNVREGTSRHAAWSPWRGGDTPAQALGHFEVYRSPGGGTPLSPQSSLAYFTGPEQIAWWAEVEASVKAGGLLPHEAPWTEAATERRKADDELLREALTSLGRVVTRAFAPST